MEFLAGGDSAPSRLRPGFCFACDRYIGTALCCPYCQQRAVLPPMLNWLKRAAWLLAVLGTGLLWFSAREIKPRRVFVAGIKPSMNRAHVELRGVTEERGEGLDATSFLLDDGTGVIRVLLCPSIAEAIALPRSNTPVRVIGTLLLHAGKRPQIAIDSNDDIVPIRAEA